MDNENITGNQINPLDPGVIQEELSRNTHVFWGICLAFCLGFLIWAYFGRLDVVSMADGRVVPSSKVKEIQHLEGGIIREILVVEGQEVKTDQPLVILEGTVSGANVDELQVRITGLQIDIIPLTAMAEEQTKLNFPADLVKNHPDLVKQATEYFNVMMKRYESDLLSQKEIIEQRNQEIKKIEAKITNSKHSLELLDKQITISSELLQENLTTEYKHLSFLREQSALKSEIEEDTVALRKARSALEEALGKLNSLKHTFKEEANQGLKKSRQELDEFTQRLKKYSDSLQRTTIRSPVDGIIKSLYMVTIGGVVTPGKTIMDIVPIGDSLVVEAHLPIQDIGFVRAGQTAIVKLSSRDARRFGKLDGKVEHISPDAISSGDGLTYYAVRIRTAKSYFEWGSQRYNLVPGMIVSTFIHTGERSILEYLLDPYIDSMGQAMQER